MDKKNFKTLAYTAFLKTFLMIFNLIFIIIGLALLVIGTVGINTFKDFFTFSPGNAIFVPIICIGLFMTIVGILSLWCTPKGIRWLLFLYSIIVFLFFLAIFSVSIIFMVKRDTFENSIKDGISSSLDSYPSEEAIDLLQSTLHCCGLNTYSDWFKTEWAKNETNVPQSCCKVSVNRCTHLNVTKPADIYVDGCYKITFNIIESKYSLIGGIGFGSAVVVLLGAILSWTLSHNLDKNKYEPVD